MFENVPKIPGLAEANLLAVTVFLLFTIAFLLFYIAFVKSNVVAKRGKSRA